MAIDHLRSAVVTEVYGGILASSPIELSAEVWTEAWVAVDSGQIVGVLLTSNQWLDDLWITQAHRNLGLGAKLLAIAEKEIADRNHEVARLRVFKSNRTAISFYIHCGWQVEREFKHEILPVQMLELTKHLKSKCGD